MTHGSPTLCAALCAVAVTHSPPPLSTMESSLRSLLAPLLPSLDPPLIEYLAGSACEGGAAAKWKSPRDAFAALGEMLESYEAVANEAEGMAKCTKLWEQMVEKGMIKGATAAAPAAAKPAAASSPAVAAPAAAAAASAPSAKPAASTATTSTPSAPAAAAASAAPVSLPEVGSTCLARYSGDGLFYRARVLAVKTVPVVRISVQFIEYGDKEEVALSATKDMQPPSADDAERKGPRRTREDEESDSDFDSEEDEQADANGGAKPPAGAKLLQSAFQIGDLEPSRAAKRAAEAAALAEREANVPGRELTSREQKMIRKRQLKQDRLVREAMARATWIPDTHKVSAQQHRQASLHTHGGSRCSLSSCVFLVASAALESCAECRIASLLAISASREESGDEGYCPGGPVAPCARQHGAAGQHGTQDCVWKAIWIDWKERNWFAHNNTDR